MKRRKVYLSRYEKRKRREKAARIATGLFALLILLAVGLFILQSNALRGSVRLSGDGALIVTDADGREERVDLPEYRGEIAVDVNGGRPFFRAEELTKETFESYSRLDYLGRCGAAFACLGRETMPEEERGSIGGVKPSGWHTVRYDDLIEDKYLYNRCHLIAFELSGENANEQNLITGTRHFNVSGMLPYENQTASYIRKTGRHVLYRVTPDFREGELVARGVLMEAQSVEDGGRGLKFCVYVHNVQPGIEIDYATGESRRTE